MTVETINVPDSQLAREITAFIKEIETPLLFNHSSRVYMFASAAARQAGLNVDEELLYASAMFHDLGLMPDYSSLDKRFEVDGANAASQFLRARGISDNDISIVWTSIALHTTLGIPEFMHPVIAGLTKGVEMDVLGIGYENFSETIRGDIISFFPRTPQFKEDIINAFYDGIKHKPHTTFGNVKADVLTDKIKNFKPANFCQIIRESRWSS